MKRYLLLMAFLCAVWRAGAQVMVSGRVVDANDGLELMDVPWRRRMRPIVWSAV